MIELLLLLLTINAILLKLIGLYTQTIECTGLRKLRCGMHLDSIAVAFSHQCACSVSHKVHGEPQLPNEVARREASLEKKSIAAKPHAP